MNAEIAREQADKVNENTARIAANDLWASGRKKIRQEAEIGRYSCCITLQKLTRATIVILERYLKQGNFIVRKDESGSFDSIRVDYYISWE